MLKRFKWSNLLFLRSLPPAKKNPQQITPPTWGEGGLPNPPLNTIWKTLYTAWHKVKRFCFDIFHMLFKKKSFLTLNE